MRTKDGLHDHHAEVRRRYPRRGDPAARHPADRGAYGGYVGAGRDSLIFATEGGGHLQPSHAYRHWYKARDAAGRPDLRWHDLRHSGAVLAAATGASLAELMGRLGHSTPQAAMRYQHVAAGRDREVAALSRNWPTRSATRGPICPSTRL